VRFIAEIEKTVTALRSSSQSKAHVPRLFSDRPFFTPTVLDLAAQFRRFALKPYLAS
jgi:hypothetical protein